MEKKYDEKKFVEKLLKYRKIDDICITISSILAIVMVVLRLAMFKTTNIWVEILCLGSAFMLLISVTIALVVRLKRKYLIEDNEENL